MNAREFLLPDKSLGKSLGQEKRGKDQGPTTEGYQNLFEDLYEVDGNH